MSQEKPIVLLLVDTDGKLERETLGDDVEFLICPDLETGVTEDQWKRVVAIIVGHLYTVTKEIQQKCPRLRVISRLGIGVDNIDSAAAAELGIYVCNVPGYGVEEVADTAFAFILSLFRQTMLLDESMKQGDIYPDFQTFIDKAHAARRIRGKTLGLIGMGNIGMAVCLRARVFGFNVLLYDPYIHPATERALGVERTTSVDNLIQRSDCVSIHCPLTPETANIINERTLKLFKKEAFLVNVSRGGQIDEAALATALKEGRLAGAALDVQEHEPFHWKGSVFEGIPNIIMTPHAGWYSKESYQDVRKGALVPAKFALTCKDGKGVENCVNMRSMNKEAVAARWN